MSDTFAKATDLADAWRPLTDAETERAWKLLMYASQKIRNAVPGIDALIAAGSVSALTAEMVAVAMVKRAMLAGGYEGVTQASDTTGPFAESTTFANPMGNLYLTAQEIIELGGVKPHGRAITAWLA